MTDNSEWPEGLKHTAQRELIYSILEEAEQPMSAQEIWAEASKKSSGYALSTVYRVLAAFEEHSMVTHQTVLGDDTALYEKIRPRDHRHYAICLSCRQMFPLPMCPFDSRKLNAITAGGFQITGHKVELYGYCSACRPAGKDAGPGKKR